MVNDGTAGIVHNQIVKMKADGSGRAILVNNPDDSSLAPAWSPLGNWIAFASGRFFPNIRGPAVARIAIVRPDGTGLTLLTESTGNAGFPSWPPDERHIVYRAASAGRSGLWIIDVEGREVRPLTDGTANDNSPAWSPGGDRIVFTSKRDGTNGYDLFSIHPDGSKLVRLTDAPGNDSHPVWSPDGQWIAFSSAREGF